jgi:hypothetical protein
VSESTLEEAPPVAEPATPEYAPAPAPEVWTLRAFARSHPWWVLSAVLAVVSLVLVVWARTRPSFDAYGWLTWGYHTLHLDLDLGGAPSWKPLPYLGTVPYAVFGHYEMWLWMFTAVGLSLLGTVFAGRITYRLIGPGPAGERRYAALAAAIVAGACVLGIEQYWHYILSAQSDPIIVTLVLGGIDAHLNDRPRLAFACGVLAALGRPEAWPWLALYAIWMWRSNPPMRKFIYVGLALIPAMWFGIPILSGNDPLVAGSIAQRSVHALHHNLIIGTLGRFTELQYLPLWLIALGTIAVAAIRRNYLILVLAACSAGWVLVEVAFALHGWPGLSRYMFQPAAVAGVLVGIGVGWALIDLPKLSRNLPRWAGVPVALVLIGVLVPGAIARMRDEHRDIRSERNRTHQIATLQNTINRLGGYQHIRNCGEPVTYVGFVSTLAWFEKLNVGWVGHRPGIERYHRKYPIVLFTPLPRGGWNVLPLRLEPSKVHRCSGLKGTYFEPRHRAR